MINTTEIDPGPAKAAEETSAPSLSEQQDGSLSVLDLLIVLASRKRFIASFVGISVLAAIVVSLLLPEWYTATSTILPPQQTSPLSSALMNQMGSLAPLAAMAGRDLGIKNPTDLYVALLKSRSVEDAMVQRFDLASRYGKTRMTDVRLKFETYREIESGQKDGLIRISIQDKDARTAAQMANAYVEEFRKLSANLAITEAAQRRIFFDQQLSEAKDKLAQAEEELKKTELETGLVQLDSQARAIIQSVAMLRAQITAKEVEITGLRAAATEENPSVIAARQELSALKAQLAKLGVRQVGASDDLLLPKGAVPEVGLEYVRKLRDVKYYETIFELLARQFEMAKLDEAKQGALVQVVDPAVVPDRRSFPKRTVIVILVLMASLAIAVTIVFLREGVNRALQKPEERERMETLRGLMSKKNFLSRA